MRSPMEHTIRVPSGDGQPIRCREWFKNMLQETQGLAMRRPYGARGINRLPDRAPLGGGGEVGPACVTFRLFVVSAPPPPGGAEFLEAPKVPKTIFGLNSLAPKAPEKIW